MIRFLSASKHRMRKAWQNRAKRQNRNRDLVDSVKSIHRAWLQVQEGDDVQPTVISDETLIAATVNENDVPETNGNFLKERKTLWSESHWAEPD